MRGESFRRDGDVAGLPLASRPFALSRDTAQQVAPMKTIIQACYVHDLLRAGR